MRILHYGDNKAIQEMNHLARCLVNNTENIAMHEHMMNFSEKVYVHILLEIGNSFVKKYA